MRRSLSLTVTNNVIVPDPGDILVYHQFNDEEDIILVYLYRRPEGAYVVMDLEDGDLVNVGQFNEGSDQGDFERFR